MYHEPSVPLSYVCNDSTMNDTVQRVGPQRLGSQNTEDGL